MLAPYKEINPQIYTTSVTWATYLHCTSLSCLWARQRSAQQKLYTTEPAQFILIAASLTCCQTSIILILIFHRLRNNREGKFTPVPSDFIDQAQCTLRDYLQETHCAVYCAMQVLREGRVWPCNRQAICLAHEIETTEDSLSDSPPVILSASFPLSPVRILTTSETGITEEETTMSESKKITGASICMIVWQCSWRLCELAQERLLCPL